MRPVRERRAFVPFSPPSPSVRQLKQTERRGKNTEDIPCTPLLERTKAFIRHNQFGRCFGKGVINEFRYLQFPWYRYWTWHATPRGSPVTIPLEVVCFVCKEDIEEDVVVCSVQGCRKAYHRRCLEGDWPIDEFLTIPAPVIDGVVCCPLHYCRTCKLRKSDAELHQCYMCPSSVCITCNESALDLCITCTHMCEIFTTPEIVCQDIHLNTS